MKSKVSYGLWASLSESHMVMWCWCVSDDDLSYGDLYPCSILHIFVRIQSKALTLLGAGMRPLNVEVAVFIRFAAVLISTAM